MAATLKTPVPTKPSKDPADHADPEAYAKAWWQYHLAMVRWAWGALGEIGRAIAEDDDYPASASGYSSYLEKIEYHGALAQHFVDVYGPYGEPGRESNPWAVKSLGLGRVLFRDRSSKSSDDIRNWAEGVKRQATLDFIEQTLPLLNEDYLLGKRD